jgi:hypothetical protein
MCLHEQQSIIDDIDIDIFTITATAISIARFNGSNYTQRAGDMALLWEHISKKLFCPGGIAASEWRHSV